MYRLLIVDNEQYTVDSLVEMFNQRHDMELEAFGVYSPAEALQWLARMKIDIVLTDIRMPGMSGLDLHKEIIRHWSKCQVIFLSGYDEFTYVQEALRGGSINYILKTEEDEVIVAAVQQAIRNIDTDTQISSLMAESRRQMQQAISALQKEYFSNLLLGDSYSLRSMEKHFRELNIPLDKSEKTLLILGRVDHWDEDFSLYDRALLLYAVQNLSSEYLEISVQHASFPYDRSEIVWLIQPKAMQGDIAEFTNTTIWRMTCQFVQGTFEGIQSTCHDLLGLSLSIAIGKAPVDWEQACAQFSELRSIYGWGLGMGQQLLLVQSADEAASKTKEHGESQSLTRHQHQLDFLIYCMESNNKMSFLSALTQQLERDVGTQRMQSYYAVVPIFLHFLDLWNLHLAIGSRLDLQKLPRLDLHADWDEAVRYLLELSRLIFDSKQSGMLHAENEVISQINRYVEANLGGDLSLTKIAEVIRHNPSYLSRLYKQKTGAGLSEFIMEARLEKAKELLRMEPYKIQEVSQAVGFLSEPYFYRFFKKATNMTPQEYRNSFVNKR